MEQEQGNIGHLKYQLRQWRRLVKYLPPTDCDRDDVAEIEKLVQLGITSQQVNPTDKGKPIYCGGCGYTHPVKSKCPVE